MGTHVLDFLIQGISQPAMTNWAPEAVAASVAAFFNFSTALTQCQIANSVSSQTTCCADSPPSACNQSTTLSQALTAAGCLQSSLSSAATWLQIVAAIDAGQPPALVLQGSGGNAYVAVYGYSAETPSGVLFIGDPVNGYTLADYAGFPTNYFGGYSWAFTYFTKSQ